MRKNFIFTLIFTFFLILIFINYQIVIDTAINSVYLWQTKVFPTLFIMFIVQEFLTVYDAAYFINLFLNNIFVKVFNLSKNGQFALVLSLISGTPTNAYIISNMYSNKKIIKDEANFLLMFSYFANPLFVYTMLSFMFTSDNTLKLMLYLYISNALVGFAFKGKKFDDVYIDKHIDNSFGKTFKNALSNSMNIILNILGIITFFMICSNIINVYIDNMYLEIFVSGFFEITTGLNSLINMNINDKIKEIIAINIISFGGLSIHTQIYTIISEYKLSYKHFLLGRIYSCIISSLLVILF